MILLGIIILSLILAIIYALIKLVSTIVLPIILTQCKMNIILFCKIFKISTEDWNNLNVPGDPASTSADKDKPPQPKTKTLKNNIIKYVEKRDRK